MTALDHPHLAAAVSWGIGYVLGCLNTGYLLVRARTGRDIRTLGSGNAGARNAGRALGRTGFLLTLLGDLLKGAAAVGFGRLLGLDATALGVTALAVVAGHNWPAPLGFRGGKGVATSCGALLVLDPVLAVALLGVAGALLAFTRQFTLSGLAAYAVAPGICVLLGRSVDFTIVLSVLALLVVGSHWRDLLARLPSARRSAPAAPSSPDRAS